MLGQPTSQICLRGNMTTSKKKRKCLLACARKGLTLSAANRQLEAECLEPVLSQEWTLWTNYYLDIVKNERDNELTRQISDQLLRVKALMTVLPSIPVTVKKRFNSIDELLQTANTIDIDENVASLEKEKEALLT